jgi:hypothetical protein
LSVELNIDLVRRFLLSDGWKVDPSRVRDGETWVKGTMFLFWHASDDSDLPGLVARIAEWLSCSPVELGFQLGVLAGKGRDAP